MNWQTLDTFLTRWRPRRDLFSLAIGALLAVLAWQFTYLFRLGFRYWLVERPWYDPLVLAMVVGVYLAVFVGLKVHRAMWRFAGFSEVKRLALSCLLAGLIAAVVVLLGKGHGVPRAVLVLHPVMALMGLCMVRIGYRMLYEHMRQQLNGLQADQRRVLVLGAGEAARRLLAGILSEGMVVVGLLDDDAAKHKARIAGVPVLGPLESLAEQVKAQGITQLIVAMPSISMPQRRRVLDLAAASGLPVFTVPSAEELRQGMALNVRDIQPEDLLGREPVKLDEAGIAEFISGRTVLITGAGGSIGSELCRQVGRYGPARLVLLEMSEFALYQVEQELGQRYPQVHLVRLVGDVKDLDGLRAMFKAHAPDIVFHAAAYKHVPLMEEHNAWTAVRNNTLGTANCARAAAEQGVQDFVLISTDKAVNPTNVMGATKRAAEMSLLAVAQQFPATRFMAVRFGNVLGSSGSVIPKFKEQIARGGPVTVTHPEITRYFMTIPEAARLVIQAGAVGETSQVYVLDMGEPVRIVDLARDLIRLSGHSLEDIPIQFSGLRPGEKLYEELLADADTTLPTPVPRLRIAKLADPTGGDALQGLLREAASVTWRPDAEVKAQLHAVVPEYHISTRGASAG